MGKILSICVILFIGIVYSSDLEKDSKINSIKEKHFKNYLSSLDTDQAREVLRSGSYEYTINKKWDHKCRHDEISSRKSNSLHKKKEFATKYSELAAKRNSENMIEDEEVSNSNLDKRATRQPIRFFLNSTYLSQDPRACYAVGDVVPIGVVSSDQSCAANDPDPYNCYYTCVETDILSPALQNFFSDNLMAAVIEIFDTILSVDRVAGNLFFNELVAEAFDYECDPDIIVPSSFFLLKGAGIPNTDTYIWVTARPSGQFSIAYAGPCNFDYFMQTETFGRPLGAIVNFNPLYHQQYAQPNYNAFDFGRAVDTAVHEFTHALGFVSYFYDSYIDRTTGQHYATSPAFEVLKTGTSPAGEPYAVNISYLGTPSLKEIAKLHYACSNVQGIELEDFGGAGTAGSHWERRQVENEYMAGYQTPVAPISYLTLSLFNDMGWYDADLSYAEYWGWGKDQGCDWLNGRCEVTWANKPGYFCSNFNQSQTSCTADRFAKGRCGISSFADNLDSYYQHFTNKTVGGNGGSDYCTRTTYTTVCANTSEVALASVFEQYSSESLCFEYSLGTSEIAPFSPQACWKTQCTENSTLQVQLNGTWYNCPTAGGPLQINAIGGVVNCPTSSLVCRVPVVTPTPYTTAGGSTSTSGSVSGTSTASSASTVLEPNNASTIHQNMMMILFSLIVITMIAFF